VSSARVNPKELERSYHGLDASNGAGPDFL